MEINLSKWELDEPAKNSGKNTRKGKCFTLSRRAESVCSRSFLLSGGKSSWAFCDLPSSAHQSVEMYQVLEKAHIFC